MEKNKQLSSDLVGILQSPQNTIFLSVASLWEIILKKEKGRLKIPKNPEEDAKVAGFTILPIEASHVLGIEKLPPHHKDPFDRLLISQAQVENLTLVSSDQKIWQYSIDILKC